MALRYDTAFLESEDYDLWARLLEVADGDNLPRRSSSTGGTTGQASERRASCSVDCQRQVALRQIEAVAPALTDERAELAWRAGAGLALPAGQWDSAADALEELVDAASAARTAAPRPAWPAAERHWRSHVRRRGERPRERRGCVTRPAAVARASRRDRAADALGAGRSGRRARARCRCPSVAGAGRTTARSA